MGRFSMNSLPTILQLVLHYFISLCYNNIYIYINTQKYTYIYIYIYIYIHIYEYTIKYLYLKCISYNEILIK